MICYKNKTMKKSILFISTISFFFFPKMTYARDSLENITTAQQFYRTPEFYIKLLTIFTIIYIITHLVSLIRRLDGLFGSAIRPFAIGIVISSVEAIDKVLEYFNLDFIQRLLSPMGEDCFHDILKLIGLCFIAYGTHRISMLIRRSKKEYPKK